MLALEGHDFGAAFERFRDALGSAARREVGGAGEKEPIDLIAAFDADEQAAFAGLQRRGFVHEKGGNPVHERASFLPRKGGEHTDWLSARAHTVNLYPFCVAPLYSDALIKSRARRIVHKKLPKWLTRVVDAGAES